MLDLLRAVWPHLTAGAGLALSIGTSAHAVLYKRDSRAAVAWVGLIWLAPVVGAVLYILLGINRVRRRVAGARGSELQHLPSLAEFSCSPEELTQLLPAERGHLVEMARLVERLTDLTLVKANRVEPLFDGDQAYPSMLEAIRGAKRSISLLVYIFSNDAAGERFVRALADAAKRGVEIRVLVDDVGLRYSMPPVTQKLRAAGVSAARFMPAIRPWATPYFNLRNHRKIMVVDGTLGFTGGMNIREHHLCGERPAFPTRDTHFRVEGPVVQELQATFVEDWQFTTGERLSGEAWFPPPQASTGRVTARTIPDGPDHHLDRMRLGFHGALGVARHSVRIVTPYFLPDATLIAALNTCALRGISVDIVVPSVNNLKMVAWASMAQMWQLLEWGCRVWMSAPPFDHSKIMVVDEALSIIGSSNWDPRSLRLNFELGMECYDQELAERLIETVDERIRHARRLTLKQVDRRSFPVRLRDGLARLAAPYL